jgi:two-component system sensor histidine kinase DesK
MTDPAHAAGRPRRRGLIPADRYLGWAPYAWLIYLTIFLIDPTVRWRGGTLTGGYTAATLLGLCLFLITYFRGYWARGRELLLIVAIQTLLGAAFGPINAGSSVFFIYAACFGAYVERYRTGAVAIGLVALAGLLTSWAVAAPLFYWITAVSFPLLIGFVSLHQTQARRADMKLRLAQEQIEHLAAIAERERIARDMHDVLGHTLSLIVLKSELAAKLATRDPERAAREIRDVEQVARKALKEVRETIRGYRASLAEEVEQSRALLGAAGIRAEIAVEATSLGRAVEETLALALREAVTNVVRHSGATACRIRLHPESSACVLEVEDDGRAGNAPEGNGLRGMRERVEALGGHVSRGPGSSGRGLQLEVRVPLAPPPVDASRSLLATAKG